MSTLEKHHLSNNWNANLAVAINNSTTTLDLDNGLDGLKTDIDGNVIFPTYFVIDSEIFEGLSATENGGGAGVDRFVVETRPANGSTAAAHVINSTAWGRVVAAHFNEILSGSDAAAHLWVQALGGDITTTQLITIRTYEGGTTGFKMQTVAQAVPDMTVLYKAGAGMALGELVVRLSDATSATMTAPAGNPRIDIVQINQQGVWSIKAGAEAGSPSAPTPDSGNVVDAEIFHRVGSVHIDDVDDTVNSYITDRRLFK